jgi:hypothetical protein
VPASSLRTPNKPDYQEGVVTLTSAIPPTDKQKLKFGTYQDVQILAQDGMRSVNASIFWATNSGGYRELQPGDFNVERPAKIKVESDRNAFKYTIMLLDGPTGGHQQLQGHKTQPGGLKNQPTQPPQQHGQNGKGPDWDAIAEGKVRHGIVCAAIQSGQINITGIDDIKTWTDFVMGK